MIKLIKKPAFLFYLICFLSLVLYSSLYYFTQNLVLDSGLSIPIIITLSFFGITTLLYGFGYFYCKDWINKQKIIILFICCLLFCLVFSWQNSLLSTDAHYYLFNNRILTEHQQNPYLVPPSNFADDQECYIVCRHLSDGTKIPYTYGPAWFLTTLIPHYLSFGNYFISLALLKLLLIFIYLASGYLIYLICKKIKPEYCKSATYLFLFNPILILETAGNAHNEIVLIFCILLSVYFLIHKKNTFAIIALFISALFKYITLPLAALLLLYILLTPQKNKIKTILSGLLTSLGITILLYAPFWAGLDTFQGLIMHSKRIAIATASPLFSIIYIILEKINSNPDYTDIIVKILFTLTFTIIILKYFKKKMILEEYLNANFWTLFTFLLIALSWLMPWYILWLFPFIIISKRIILLFLLSYVPLILYITIVSVRASFAILIIFCTITALIYLIEKQNPLALTRGRCKTRH